MFFDVWVDPAKPPPHGDTLNKKLLLAQAVSAARQLPSLHVERGNHLGDLRLLRLQLGDFRPHARDLAFGLRAAKGLRYKGKLDL